MRCWSGGDALAHGAQAAVRGGNRFLLGANQLMGNQPRAKDRLISCECLGFSYGYQCVEIYFRLDCIKDAINPLGGSQA